MNYSIYNTSTGEIRNSLTCPDSLLVPNVPEGCSAILGGFDNSLYRVDLTTYQPVMKTHMVCAISKSTIDADGFDGAIISGLPAGTFALFEGLFQAVPDGAIEFAVDVPGDYEIILQHPLYLDTTVTITAQ